MPLDERISFSNSHIETNGGTSEIAKAKDEAIARTEEIHTRISARLTEYETLQEVDGSDLEDIIKRAKDYTKWGDRNYEKTSWQECRKMRLRLEQETSVIRGQETSLYRELNEAQEKVWKHEHEKNDMVWNERYPKGRFKQVRRLLLGLKIRHTDKQLTKARADRDEKDQRRQTIGRELVSERNQLEDLARGLLHLEQYLMHLACGPDVEEIMKAWQEYQDVLVNDSGILPELRDIYIRREIEPYLVSAQKEGRVTPEQAQAARRIITEFIQAERIRDYDSLQELQNQLYEIAGAFYILDSEFDFLRFREDQIMIARIAWHLTDQHVQPILDEITKRSGYRSSLGGPYDYATNPNFGESGPIRTQVQPLKAETIVGRRKNMIFFKALQETETGNELFGDLLKDMDKQVFVEVVSGSLDDKDGGYIDALAFYPTPEVIRNLVVLATADSKGYRLVHANWTLNHLAKRSDWPQLLDQAIAVYPALGSVKEILLNWSWTEYAPHADLEKKAAVLNSQLESSGEDDERLRQMAREALPTNDWLRLMVKDGVIDAKDEEDYRRACALLQRLAAEVEMAQEASNAEIGHHRHRFESSLHHFEWQVRQLISRMNEAKPGDHKFDLAYQGFLRYVELARIWLENQDNPAKLQFISCYEIIDLTQVQDKNKHITTEQLQLLARLYDTSEALQGKRKFMYADFIRQHHATLLSEEKIAFLNRFDQAYASTTDSLTRTILSLCVSGEIPFEHALTLPNTKMLTSEEFAYVGTQHPEVFLASNEALAYSEEFMAVYEGMDKGIYQNVASAVGHSGLDKKLALVMPKKMPGVFKQEANALRSTILNGCKVLLRTEADIDFLNQMIGQHGKRSEVMIKDYQRCVEAGAITDENRQLALDFTQEFRVLTPTLFTGYVEAVRRNRKEMFLTELKAFSDKLIASEPMTPEEIARPYYRDLIMAIYPSNSAQWSSYESNDACADRTADLSEFKFRRRYELDLLSAADITTREGQVLDQAAVDQIKSPILALAAVMEQKGFDLEVIQQELAVKVDDLLNNIKNAGGLEGVDLSQVKSLEEKMFLLLIDSTYGFKTVPEADLKNLLIQYEFAFFDDIRQYIQGTSDRVSQAKNQDYALLCELHSFYSDRIKEVNRRLVQAGFANEHLRLLMPSYFENIARDAAQSQTRDMLNRVRADRLGLSDSFIKQIAKTLKGKSGREYTPDQVRKLIRIYETQSRGLQLPSQSEKPRTKAFLGQLQKQRQETIRILQELTGEAIDPEHYNLGFMNLEDLVVATANITAEEYSEQQFAAYTAQRFLNTFAADRLSIEAELEKFVSSSGRDREVLYAYFTKTKPSANARMVGGVCVSGDNPAKSGPERPNQWDQPHFLQLVFQDPESLRCQGLVLLHHFTDSEGKRILTASFNPSSTYLYTVDEQALFKGIMGTLEEFAAANNFDMVTMSSNGAIRTNRTGGEFQRAMDQRKAEVGQTYRFEEPQVFSYKPSYQLQDMDVIWLNPASQK